MESNFGDWDASGLPDGWGKATAAVMRTELRICHRDDDVPATYLDKMFAVSLMECSAE
jgi:hypothetical protein